MARSRRVTAFVLAILLVEPLLAGVGYTCSMPEVTATGGRTATGLETTVVTASSPAPAIEDDCPEAMLAGKPRTDAPTPVEQPCSLPWAPLGCRGAPCAPATLASATFSPSAADPMPVNQPSLAVLALTSVVRAPELPPPRA